MQSNPKSHAALMGAAEDLYADIVRQSRTPALFAVLDIPDTLEGRFDSVTLHMVLVLRRLKQEREKTTAFAQSLFDVMFKNMDYAFREMGVGDLSVGKKVRGLAEDFYGRTAAYDAALDESDDEALSNALDRNIYSSTAPEKWVLGTLVTYIHNVETRLKEQSCDRLMLGLASFPAVPTPADDQKIEGRAH